MRASSSGNVTAGAFIPVLSSTHARRAPLPGRRSAAKLLTKDEAPDGGELRQVAEALAKAVTGHDDPCEAHPTPPALSAYHQMTMC